MNSAKRRSIEDSKATNIQSIFDAYMLNQAQGTTENNVIYFFKMEQALVR